MGCFEGDLVIPLYQYCCKKCGHECEDFRFRFEGGPTKCPECKAKAPHFRQLIGDGIIGRVKNQPKTVGQQAEINNRKLGKEQMELMAEAEKKQKRSGWEGRLPEGARVVERGEAVTPPWRDGTFGIPAMEKPLDLSEIKNTEKYIRTGEKT